MILTALIIYFFLPHQSNNHKAKILNPILIGISVLMFVVSQVLFSFLPKITPVVLGYTSTITPGQIITLTNQGRLRAGVSEVSPDPLLTKAAEAKAANMLAKNYWAHTAPDGTEPWKFVLDADYKYRFAGENLARDFKDPEAVVKAWMDSPSHRENLLSGHYQDIGVAVVQGRLNGVDTTLVVQFFGTKMTIGGAVDKRTGESLTATPSSSFVVGGTNEKKNDLELIKDKLVKVSPFLVTKRFAFFVISLFTLIFTIDMLLVKRKNVQRVSSKSFAHILFFVMILIALFVSKAGVVL